MSRFNTRNTRPAATSPIRSTGQTTINHQGGNGHLREPKSELFLLAVANMVGQNTFYEKAGHRDDRYTQLIRQLAVEDPQWTAQFLGWLRSDGNMRTASLVGAAEFAAARLAAKLDGQSRQVINAVLQRPDEPGELLAYWTSQHGRNLPKPVKRGIADAVQRLYNSKALLKYDTDSKGYRFGDVLNLVHATPHPDKPWQGDLFKYALDRRHNPDTAVAPGSNRTLTANLAIRSLEVGERREFLRLPDAADRLSAAGFTWEMLAGWLQGPMDAEAWQAIIPSMGTMALLRNLRNFDEAGVSDEVAEQVAARISDPDQVAKSRQFPFRFLAAFKHAPSLRWGYALEKALGYSLANVPALPGRTLVLVDRSGSMFGGISEQTKLNRADAAAVFGTAVALRAAHADLVQFGTHSVAVPYGQGESVLRIIGRFLDLGGTNTAEAVRQHYRGHDRVVVVTDEQTGYGYYGSDPTAQVPANVPVYTWNLAGYRAGHGPSGGGNRHAFGGLTDHAFRMIPLLEAGRDAAWPWEQRIS
ncbi:TROVE domain-containing protein [Kitasatospora sp. NPDC059408]|uniref:TROVE domain-containing protein n=1 Tax=Kitasatospora sp. NPDC059408 TaxID=3346823 RepID=UPI00367D06D9